MESANSTAGDDRPSPLLRLASDLRWLSCAALLLPALAEACGRCCCWDGCCCCAGWLLPLPPPLPPLGLPEPSLQPRGEQL